MSETTQEEFKRLILFLLERDGVDREMEAGNTAKTLLIDTLRTVLFDGKIEASLPSAVMAMFGASDMRHMVYDDFNEEYSIPMMSEWIPKLKDRLVLERLADV
jgi:hypothetical protein